MKPVLVIGATGRVGREVVAQLLEGGVPVRALSRRPEGGAAETAPIDVRDTAAVAARALYEDGHTGGDYVLTGPESLSQAEQVTGRGHAAGRVGGNDRRTGVRDLDRVRRPRITRENLSAVGRRSRRRVSDTAQR